MTMYLSPTLIGKKESVVDEMLLLNPYQIPMLTLLGFGPEIANTKHEWNEDNMFPQSSTTTNAAGTGTSLVMTSVEPFRAGQVVRNNDELISITSIATLTMTVVRGYAGTTPESISIGDTIEVMFNENDEGQVARAARNKVRTNVYNYTQIFDDSIDISGTAGAVDQHGISDLYELEKMKKLQELALSLEKSVITGVKYQSSGVRQFGGMRSFITTNVNNASAAEVSLTLLNNAVQNVYDAGGFKSGGRYAFVVPSIQKRKVSGIQDTLLQFNRAENTRGTVVSRIVTDFGEFPVILDPNVPSDEILFVDLDRMAIRPLRGRSFFHKYLGEVGDSVKGMVLGEYTFEFKQEKAHARIYGLKTT